MPKPARIVPHAFVCHICGSVALRVYSVRPRPEVKTRELRCRKCGARIITRETVVLTPPKTKSP